MRRRLYIPDEVRQAIREHLEAAVNRAVSGYLSAHEDEDTLTGHLGGSLRSGTQRVFVARSQTEIPGEWKWSITYYKFRGRGPRATERVLGADGLFELNLITGSRSEQKSLLFQAKVIGEGDRGLLEQCIKLTTWREAAFVLVYSEGGFTSVPLDSAVAARGALRPDMGTPLAVYLGTDFLDCDVGDNELHYDARGKRLIWRAMNGEVVATQFAVNHRVAVNIEAPRWGEDLPGVDRLVASEDIYQFRMQASEDDVLGLRGNLAPTVVRQAQKRLALTYHPDRFSELDVLHRQIMNRRMQEVNAAVHKLRRSK